MGSFKKIILSAFYMSSTSVVIIGTLDVFFHIEWCMCEVVGLD